MVVVCMELMTLDRLVLLSTWHSEALRSSLFCFATYEGLLQRLRKPQWAKLEPGPVARLDFAYAGAETEQYPT